MKISSLPVITPIIRYVAIAVITVVSTSLFFKYCSKPNNEIITNKSLTTPFKSETKYLKDSTHYLEVEAKLAESKGTIAKLQDSLTRAISKNSGIKPTGLISFKSSMDFKDLKGSFKDSVDHTLDTIIAQQKTIDSNKIDFSKLISVPRQFTFQDKDSLWLKGEGTVRKNSVDIDRLHAESDPTVVFGETFKKFLGIPIGRPTIKAAIGDKNPYVSQSDPKVYLYQPKQSKIGLVVGTGVSFNGKNIQYQPVQLTLGFKIF